MFDCIHYTFTKSGNKISVYICMAIIYHCLFVQSLYIPVAMATYQQYKHSQLHVHVVTYALHAAASITPQCFSCRCSLCIGLYALYQADTSLCMHTDASSSYTDKCTVQDRLLLSHAYYMIPRMLHKSTYVTGFEKTQPPCTIINIQKYQL